MGDLSKNLSRAEFMCPCGSCKAPTVDSELVTVLQECVDHFAKAQGKDRLVIVITSGVRCPTWNGYIWGKRNASLQVRGRPEEKPVFNSMHIAGIAADFVIRGVSSLDVYRHLDFLYRQKYGIGMYPDRTHIDTRHTKARWECT